MEEWEKLMRHEEAASSLAFSSHTLAFLDEQGIASIGDLLDADRSFFPAPIADEVQRVLVREELIEPSLAEPDFDAERRAKRKKRTRVERLIVAIDRGDRVMYGEDDPGHWEDELRDLDRKHHDAALRELRRGLQLDKGGKHGRRVHAIAWLAGREAPEVRALLAEPTRNTPTMLDALVQRHRTLPDWMLRPLIALWNQKKDTRVARAMCRIASPSVVPVLFPAIHGKAEILMQEVLAGCPAWHACHAIPAGALERHRELIGVLFEVNHRYPDHWALRELAVMSRLARAHPEVVKLNAKLLVEMWQTRSTPGDPGSPPTALVEHAEANIGMLDAKEQRTVANLLLGDEPALFPLGAAAWIRADDPLELAERVRSTPSDTAIEARRWRAMSERAASDPREALHDFFDRMVDECAPHLRLAALRAVGARSRERMTELTERAFDVTELEAIVKVAVEHDVDIVKPVLMRFSEPKMTLEASMIALVKRLMREEHRDWLRAELDEIPLPDRRRQLAQLL